MRFKDPIEPSAYDWQEAHANGRSVVCQDWDAHDMHPRYLYDTETGQCLGQLMPVDDEAVQSSPGIQSWSKRNG